MAAPLKIYVHLARGTDVVGFKSRYERGETPEYTPYELHLAERPGVSVAFSSEHRGIAPRRILDAINRRIHFGIDHAWANRKAIEACDIVWTMSEGEAFAVAALMAARLVPRRPIIGTAIWLFGNWATLSPSARAMFRGLSSYISVLTVHSRKCLSIAATAGLQCPVELSFFGVSERSYRPSAQTETVRGRPIRVLSAGNDLTRDWHTLLKACGNDDRFVISAWTPALTEADQTRFDNLRLPKPHSLQQIHQMYVEADVVVIPMFDNVYSGITVALEAAAQIKPVVSSETGGVPTYFDHDEVLYVRFGDADELRNAVLLAQDSGLVERAKRANIRFISNDYTTDGMVNRLLAISNRVLMNGSSASTIREQIR